MEWITNPEAWIALATLTILEIVLGIDNVVFIAIVAGRLPEEQQSRAWKVGLSLAMLSRLALLFSIVWVVSLEDPWFSILSHEISGKDIILLGGGLSVMIMLFAAKSIGDFVDAHPTIKMLALSFLIMVGFTLIVEGFDVHVPKGYIYFAMMFSVSVEMLNLRLRKKQTTAVALIKKNVRNNHSGT